MHYATVVFGRRIYVCFVAYRSEITSRMQLTQSAITV